MADVFISWSADLDHDLDRKATVDDVDGLRRRTQDLDHANEIWKSWALSTGGSVIRLTGSKGSVQIPADRLEDLPGIKHQYGLSLEVQVAVGVGTKLSEADLALEAARLRGGDQVVLYTEEIQQELAEARGEDRLDKAELVKMAKDKKPKTSITDDLRAKVETAEPTWTTNSGGISGTPSVIGAEADHGEYTWKEQWGKRHPASTTKVILGSDIYYCPAGGDYPGQVVQHIPKGEDTEYAHDQKRRAFVIEHHRDILRSRLNSVTGDRDWGPAHDLSPEEKQMGAPSGLDPGKVKKHEPLTKGSPAPMGAQEASSPALNPNSGGGGMTGQSRPSTPTPPRAEASEHSQGEAMRSLAENETPPVELTHAGQDLEDHFHQAAQEQDQKDQAAAQSQEQSAEQLKQQVVQVLQKLKSAAPVLEQIKQQAPEVYQAVMGTVQAMLAMAKQVVGDPAPQEGEEQVQKSEEDLEKMADPTKLKWTAYGPKADIGEEVAHTPAGSYSLYHPSYGNQSRGIQGYLVQFKPNQQGQPAVELGRNSYGKYGSRQEVSKFKYNAQHHYLGSLIAGAGQEENGLGWKPSADAKYPIVANALHGHYFIERPLPKLGSDQQPAKVWYLANHEDDKHYSHSNTQAVLLNRKPFASMPEAVTFIEQHHAQRHAPIQRILDQARQAWPLTGVQMKDIQGKKWITEKGYRAKLAEVMDTEVRGSLAMQEFYRLADGDPKKLKNQKFREELAEAVEERMREARVPVMNHQRASLKELGITPGAFSSGNRQHGHLFLYAPDKGDEVTGEGMYYSPDYLHLQMHTLKEAAEKWRSEHLSSSAPDWRPDEMTAEDFGAAGAESHIGKSEKVLLEVLSKATKSPGKKHTQKVPGGLQWLSASGGKYHTASADHGSYRATQNSLDNTWSLDYSHTGIEREYLHQGLTDLDHVKLEADAHHRRRLEGIAADKAKAAAQDHVAKLGLQPVHEENGKKWYSVSDWHAAMDRLKMDGIAGPAAMLEYHNLGPSTPGKKPRPLGVKQKKAIKSSVEFLMNAFKRDLDAGIDMGDYGIQQIVRGQVNPEHFRGEHSGQRLVSHEYANTYLHQFHQLLDNFKRERGLVAESPDWRPDQLTAEDYEAAQKAELEKAAFSDTPKFAPKLQDGLNHGNRWPTPHGYYKKDQEGIRYVAKGGLFLQPVEEAKLQAHHDERKQAFHLNWKRLDSRAPYAPFATAHGKHGKYIITEGAKALVYDEKGRQPKILAEGSGKGLDKIKLEMVAYKHHNQTVRQILAGKHSRFQQPQAGEVDWRPGETLPEDYEAKSELDPSQDPPARNSKELEKDGLDKAQLPMPKAPKEHHVILPVGSVKDGPGKVKVQHGNGKQGWVQVRAGQILSEDGHAISSRNPGGK